MANDADTAATSIAGWARPLASEEYPSLRAPNAPPHVERFIRTLRVEALDHFLFLSVDHIRHVVSEYIRCYNGGASVPGHPRSPGSVSRAERASAGSR